MPNFRIVFVHGYTASHKADWYPQISPELKKLGADFAIPDLPGGKFPHANEWLEILHKEISKSTKPLVLVGHSLGTRAILLYLEKFRPKVEKVFLIAPLANRIDNAKRRNNRLADFFESKVDTESIKTLVGKFYVLHSQDDDSVPYEQGVEIAKDLDAQLITFEDRKHFSNSENAKFVLEILRKELNF